MDLKTPVTRRVWSLNFQSSCAAVSYPRQPFRSRGQRARALPSAPGDPNSALRMCALPGPRGAASRDDLNFWRGVAAACAFGATGEPPPVERSYYPSVLLWPEKGLGRAVTFGKFFW